MNNRLPKPFFRLLKLIVLLTSWLGIEFVPSSFAMDYSGTYQIVLKQGKSISTLSDGDYSINAASAIASASDSDLEQSRLVLNQKDGRKLDLSLEGESGDWEEVEADGESGRFKISSNESKKVLKFFKNNENQDALNRIEAKSNILELNPAPNVIWCGKTCDTAIELNLKPTVVVTPTQDRNAASTKQMPPTNHTGNHGTVDKPNIVFLLVDDMDYASMKFFPKLKSLFVDQGIEFTKSYVSNSLCCPSRATLLRGQYPHNHGVLSNEMPTGGFQRFLNDKREESTISTWLEDAGYETVLFGKYLNHYPLKSDPNYIPKGWSEWFGADGHAFWQGFNYKLFSKPARDAKTEIQFFGEKPEDYLTDVISKKANDFIERNAEKPFFMYISTGAPHQPATPAPRHKGAFSDADVRIKAGGQTSFDEENVKDKPKWMQKIKRISSERLAKLNKLYRMRLQSMLAVEELAEELVKTLEKKGLLEKTYIVFYSDNGFHLGEHRLNPGKWTAYEEDIKVPFYIRGPGIPKGEKRSQLVLNNDIAPTFAALAGVKTPDFVDGRNLMPLVKSEAVVKGWRDSVLIEHEKANTYIPSFNAIRTDRFLYVKYPGSGFTELYDVETDPSERHNISGDSAFSTTEAEMEQRLPKLVKCSGESCQKAESASD